jgi:hypothetical protein
MRALSRRLNKLDHQFGLSHKHPRLLMIVTGYRTLAIDEDACVKILDEAGFLPAGGVGVVNLMDLPPGMNAAETERYVRENGAKICGPRVAQSPDGVGSA